MSTLIGGEGLAELPLLPEDAAEIAVRLCIVGLQREGPAVGRDCLFKPALPAISIAEIIVDHGEIRIQLSDSTQSHDRFVELAPSGKGDTEVEVGIEEIGIQLHSLAEGGD